MNKSGHGVLIVGASYAGIHLAGALREKGYSEPITMVGAEKHVPYERPPLSKAFLKQETQDSDLQMRSEAYLRDLDIQFIANERITGIHRNADGGRAFSQQGNEYQYDRLALTVGARPLRLDIPGAELKGIHYLRDLQDARNLRDALCLAQKIVVIGGGFIGLEAAASAAASGKSVAVVTGARILARSVGVTTSDFIHHTHLSAGVQIIAGQRPARIHGRDGNAAAVELRDGTRIDCDLVVVGIGATPRIELATALGLNVRNGIVVTPQGITSDGTTLAAGDCVAVDWHNGSTPTRFECVNSAVEQAKTVASTILGDTATAPMAPWFWSDQFDVKLQAIGTPHDHTHAVLRGSLEERKFTVPYYNNTGLVGAESVNRPADFMAIRSAVARNHTFPADAAADTSVPLKTLAVAHQPLLTGA